jgi:hypothetical protein
MSMAAHSNLEALRSQYEAACSIYQNYVAAVSLAQGDEDGVSESLLSQLSTAAEQARTARRRYRAALIRTSLGSSASLKNG